jgi:hypothetical protein
MPRHSEFNPRSKVRPGADITPDLQPKPASTPDRRMPVNFRAPAGDPGTTARAPPPIRPATEREAEPARIKLLPRPRGAQSAPADPRPNASADGGIHIGSIAIHIDPPPPTPQRASPARGAPARGAPARGPLARGFSSPFGLRQG